MAETKHHIHRIRNSSNKAAKLARTVVESKVVTTEDIADGFLKRPDIRATILRSTVDDKRVQRWQSASEEIWAQVEIIASCFLEDVPA